METLACCCFHLLSADCDSGTKHQKVYKTADEIGRKWKFTNTIDDKSVIEIEIEIVEKSLDLF